MIHGKQNGIKASNYMSECCAFQKSWTQKGFTENIFICFWCSKIQIDSNGTRNAQKNEDE